MCARRVTTSTVYGLTTLLAHGAHILVRTVRRVVDSWLVASCIRHRRHSECQAAAVLECRSQAQSATGFGARRDSASIDDRHINPIVTEMTDDGHS